MPPLPYKATGGYGIRPYNDKTQIEVDLGYLYAYIQLRVQYQFLPGYRVGERKTFGTQHLGSKSQFCG